MLFAEFLVLVWFFIGFIVKHFIQKEMLYDHKNDLFDDQIAVLSIVFWPLGLLILYSERKYRLSRKIEEKL